MALVQMTAADAAAATAALGLSSFCSCSAAVDAAMAAATTAVDANFAQFEGTAVFTHGSPLISNIPVYLEILNA